MGDTVKLFDGFEAVKFYEENLIFVTHNRFLYYIYNSKYNHWRKHRNFGNDSITVSNYDDVTKAELIDAMNGIFPQKETDFMRLCNPKQLCIIDMMDLLNEDYPRYASDYEIMHTIHRFLLASDVCHKSYAEIKKLLEKAVIECKDNKRVLSEIKELCFTVIGRDIFKEEIGIVDGHDPSSYFWIMPARVIDYSSTDNLDNVAEMRSSEISIEEHDVFQYLTPFLYKYYDDELKANKSRIEYQFIDEDGNEQVSRISGFEWNLTHNFFTFDSVAKMLKDIRDTIVALSSGDENEFSVKVKKDTKPELIIDFYNRFIYRMEYMMKVGKEKGYDLISFMGP